MTDPIARVEAVLAGFADTFNAPNHSRHCNVWHELPCDCGLSLVLALMPDLLAVARAAEEVVAADAGAERGDEGGDRRWDAAFASMVMALDTFRSHVTELLPEEE